MKLKKVVGILDAMAIMIITIIALSFTSVNQSIYNVIKNSGKAVNEEMSFDLLATPEEAKVKAGATVEVTLTAANINVGENGLNSIVGYLNYDESLFDAVEITPQKNQKESGISEWRIELNKIKGDPLYGKFCIYTMQEGIKEDEEVVKIKFVLKKDLKPQTTKVVFSNLETSDGNYQVCDQDRIVTIIIYEDPAAPVTPEEPAKPVQTGDTKIIAIVGILLATIIINILAFCKNKKAKIISSIAVLVIGLLGIGAVVFAADNNSNKINAEEVLNKLLVQESWLNSDKYLVTDETVSRFPLGTKIEDITTKFNKNIKVIDGEKEVTEGKLCTGMEITVDNPTEKDADGERKYKVSVLGDLDADGESNQVELTQIIRNTVDNQKWKLEDEKFISADITVDAQITETDVLASVKYIVYGKMEVPDFEPVKAPKVEIISGEYNEEAHCYTGDVYVKITENEKDANKTQYKINKEGAEIVAYTEIERKTPNEEGKFEKIIKMEEDGIYKISAYTTGKLGNRSEIPYVIVNRGISNDLFEYKVEYYYDGEIDETATEIQVAEYGDKITTYTDKNKVGYKLDRVEPVNKEGKAELTVTEKEEENVIKVYYVRDEFKYTVHYFYDNVEDTTKVEEDSALFNEKITIYEDKNIPGYKLDKVEPLNADDELELTITEKEEDNVINVYYVKDTFKYTVHYFYDEVENVNAKIENTATFGDKITTYEDKVETGYKFDKVEPLNSDGELELTITEKEANNVINVYYIRDEFKYTVHYFYDNVEDTTKVEEDTALFNKKITTYDDKNITGYKFDKVEPLNADGELELTITEKEEDNVINVYYARDEFKYTVHYFYDNVEDTTKVEEDTALFNEKITTYEDKNITGYKLDKVEPLNGDNELELTITEKEEDNIINVYYIKDTFAYSVHYFYEGVEDTTKTYNKTATFGDIITTYEDKNITGYKFDKVIYGNDDTKTSLTITAAPAQNIIYVYYVKDTFNYSIHYYFDNVEDVNLKETKSAKFETEISTYTDKVKDNYKFDKVIYGKDTNKTSLKITEDASKNVIDVYYVLATSTLTIHHYLDGTTTKIAEDENLEMDFGDTFEVTTLMDANNKIKVNDVEQTGDRESISTEKYSFESASIDNELTVDANGKVTGEFVKGMEDIIYYYSINTFTVTGEVYDGNASIKIGTNEIISKKDAPQTSKTLKEAEYDTNLSLMIQPTKGYGITGVYSYKGDKIGGDYSLNNGDVLNQTQGMYMIKNIKEDEHIVVRTELLDTVVKIIAIPDDAETSDEDGDYVGREYPTLGEAIDDALKINQTRTGDENCKGQTVEIQIMEKDSPVVIYETNAIINKNFVTIDLNGQKIENNDSEEATLLVGKDCILQIIDSSLNQTGTIENTEGEAIYCYTGSTLILGNEPRPISISCPTIKGNTYGINRETDSTLNFYDGQVIGETKEVAIAGYTDDTHTPELYEVISVDESPKQTAYLSIPRGIEAMIGTSKYETLELAFEAVENTPNASASTPIEIDVVAPSVTTEAPITLSQDRNVILDLNGNNITGTHNGYVFINQGVMEIKDSSSEVEEDYHYSELIENDENYYFTKVGDHLEANNSGIDNSTAKSYMKIDLSQESSDKIFRVNVNANISSEYNGSSRDSMFLYVTESTDEPDINSEEGKIGSKCGIGSPTDYIYSGLEGGKTYYLHLFYKKNENSIMYLDNCQINDITVSEMIDGVPTNTKSVLKELISGKGTVESSSNSVLKNEANAKLTISSGNINTNSPIENRGIMNINGGTVKALNKSHVINGYATVEGQVLNINAGKIIGCVYNGNINVKEPARLFAESVNYCIQQGEGNLIIDGGTFTESSTDVSSCLYISASKDDDRTFVINDGKFLGFKFAIRTDIPVTINNAYLYVADTYYGLECSKGATIKNAVIKGANGIEGSSGELNIDYVDIDTKGIGIKYHGGEANIYDANIRSKGVAIHNDCTWSSQEKGIFNIYGGKYVSSVGPGNHSDGTVNIEIDTFNIYGGEFVNTNSSGIALHINEMSFNTRKPIVNIGKKNIGEDAEISTTSPTVKSNNVGVFVEASGAELNFYDGQIIAKPGSVINGKVNSIEPVNSENKPMCITIDEITEDEKTLNRYYLAECDPVAKISKSSAGLDLSGLTENIDYIINGNDYNFFKLDTAVSVCSKSAGNIVTTIDLVKDIITTDTINVEEGQNIKLDLAGYTITSYTSLGFKNEGTLDIENSEETGRVNVHGTVIQNYGTLVTKAYLDNVQDYKNRNA